MAALRTTLALFVAFGAVPLAWLGAIAAFLALSLLVPDSSDGVAILRVSMGVSSGAAVATAWTAALWLAGVTGARGRGALIAAAVLGSIAWGAWIGHRGGVEDASLAVLAVCSVLGVAITRVLRR